MLDQVRKKWSLQNYIVRIKIDITGCWLEIRELALANGGFPNTSLIYFLEIITTGFREAR